MKKIISILISLSMILAMMPNIALADAATTTHQVVADTLIRANSMGGYTFGNDTTTGLAQLYVNDADRGAYNAASMMYYMFEIPEVPEGKIVTKATFTIYAKGASISNNSYDLNFYNVYDSWNETSLNWNNQPIDTDDSGTRKPTINPVVVHNIGANTGDRYDKHDLDVKDLVNNHLKSSVLDKTKFSFAFLLTCKYPERQSKGDVTLYTKETPDNQSLVPTLTLTIEDIPEFAFESVSPVSGNTVASDTPVIFSFNNEIKADSVTAAYFEVEDIAGETVVITDEDIVVSGSTISLNKEWDAFGYYTVNLNGEVTDIYDKTISVNSTTKFNVEGVFSQETQTFYSKPLIRVCSASSSNSDNSYCNSTHTKGTFQVSTADKVQTQGHYILFQFDLSEVDENKVVTKAELVHYNDSNRWFTTAYVDNYSWTSDAGVDTEYFASLKSAYENTEKQLTYKKLDGSPCKHTVDATSPVAEVVALDAADKKITFAIKYDYSGAVYNTNSSYKPTLTVTLSDKSFEAVSNVPAKGGKINGVAEPVSFTFGTTIASEYVNNEYIKLINIDTNREVSANITSDGNTYTVTPTQDLDEVSEHIVVLKSGIKDISGDSLSSDKVVHRFTSGIALEFNTIKFTYDKAPASYDVEEISSYSSGEEVTAVAEYSNRTTSARPAILIVALYDADGSLIKVEAEQPPFEAPSNETTLFATTINVPVDSVNTYIKAFVWDNLSTLRPVCEHERIDQLR